jgi:hypothetical protein
VIALYKIVQKRFQYFKKAFEHVSRSNPLILEQLNSDYITNEVLIFDGETSFESRSDHASQIEVLQHKSKPNLNNLSFSLQSLQDLRS